MAGADGWVEGQTALARSASLSLFFLLPSSSCLLLLPFCLCCAVCYHACVDCFLLGAVGTTLGALAAIAIGVAIIIACMPRIRR